MHKKEHYLDDCVQIILKIDRCDEHMINKNINEEEYGQ